MKLSELKSQIETNYKSTMTAFGFNTKKDGLVPLLYQDQDPKAQGTHLSITDSNLIIYLIAKQMGLKPNQDIPEYILSDVPSFYYAPDYKALLKSPTPNLVKELIGHKDNINFKSIIDNFLNNNDELSKTIVVAAASLDAVNNSHFITIDLQRKANKVLHVSILDSVLGENLQSSAELSWQQEVIRLFIPNEYTLLYKLAPVKSQNAANCLIHAVNNALQKIMNIENTLDKSSIIAIRQTIFETLKHGEIPQHQTPLSKHQKSTGYDSIQQDLAVKSSSATLETIKHQFLSAHKEQMGGQWFQFFRKTAICPRMSMHDIILHAQGQTEGFSGNRSFKILKLLGFMNEKKEIIGTLKNQPETECLLSAHSPNK